MQCVFSSVKASNEWRVPSLPDPDSLHPPNGMSSDLTAHCFNPSIISNFLPDQPAVRPDCSNLQSLGYSMDCSNIFRPDTGTKSIPMSKIV